MSQSDRRPLLQQPPRKIVTTDMVKDQFTAAGALLPRQGESDQDYQARAQRIVGEMQQEADESQAQFEARQQERFNQLTAPSSEAEFKKDEEEDDATTFLHFDPRISPATALKLRKAKDVGSSMLESLADTGSILG